MTALNAKVEGRVEQDLKDWLGALATKTDRSEGHHMRIALREYRAKVSRRKGETA